VKAGLKYIADSPPREHGGFHPQTVDIAKQALARIEYLEGAIRSLPYSGTEKP
jgi:hypothetical protein